MTVKRRSHVILDGYNLIHRARGGFQKGDWPIAFNFFRGLRPLIARFNDVVDVTVVLEGRPKRQESALPSYKGNRGPPPDGFERQKGAIIEILELMGLKLTWHPDFEADDVIHNLLTALSLGEDNDRHFHTTAVVVSSDSDFTQLLQRDLRPCYNPRSGIERRMDDSGCITVWNWRGNQELMRPDYDYVKWKALRGDPTDNIPKCPGMTDRVASEVLHDPLRFEGLMQHQAFKESYERNLDLIRFEDFTAEEIASCVRRGGSSPDWVAVRARFEDFGFRSMLKDETWKKWVMTFTNVGF